MLQSWQRYFPGVVNLGVGGDRTEHVLWRLVNGELAPTNPKVRRGNSITKTHRLGSVSRFGHIELATLHMPSQLIIVCCG